MTGCIGGYRNPAVPGACGASMPGLRHGGDTLAYRERFGRDPLDFSANTNPLGMSPAARVAAGEALSTADRYPDPVCRELRCALSRETGVEARHIRCGNGAADLLFRLCYALRPRRVLLCAPTFSEYEHAVRAAGAQIEFYVLGELNGLALDQGVLERIVPGIDMVFVCEPNNPTGLLSDRSVLRGLRLRCRETGARLVVDECFAGFCRASSADPMPTMTPFVERMPELVILRAFTKLYGMAGLRLGYLMCSDEGLLSNLDAAGQPWPVSSVAQAAGVAALGDATYIDKTLALVSAERARLSAALAEAGCDVWPSRANYLLLFCPVAGICDAMAEAGVMVRDCSGYRGLREGYVRMAVRTPGEDDRLAAAFAGRIQDAVGRGISLLRRPDLPAWWQGSFGRRLPGEPAASAAPSEPVREGGAL